MYNCAVQLIINDRESTIGKFEKWSDANKFKLFREQTDSRDVEYKVIEI